MFVGSKKNFFTPTSPSWSCLFCNNICVRCLDDRCWSNLPDRWRNHWDRVLMIMGHLAGVGATAVATHVTFMNRPLKQKFLRDTICKAKKIKGCWTLKAKRIRDGDPEGEKIMGWIKGWFPENFEKIKGSLNPERFFLSLKSGTECIHDSVLCASVKGLVNGIKITLRQKGMRQRLELFLDFGLWF